VLVGESPHIGSSSGCCAIDCEPVISTLEMTEYWQNVSKRIAVLDVNKAWTLKYCYSDNTMYTVYGESLIKYAG
jgi:hypothetical protein